jgi:hypothetical protein
VLLKTQRDALKQMHPGSFNSRKTLETFSRYPSLARKKSEEESMLALVKLAALGGVLWYGALTVYDLPMRKLEAAVFKQLPQKEG